MDIGEEGKPYVIEPIIEPVPGRKLGFGLGAAAELAVQILVH